MDQKRSRSEAPALGSRCWVWAGVSGFLGQVIGFDFKTDQALVSRSRHAPRLYPYDQVTEVAS
jgi:hypothetical protein